MAVEDWDSRAASWLDAPQQVLWRRHSDAVNEMLIARWLQDRPERVLKTDLWDEAVGEGLFPALAQRAGQIVGIDVSQAVVEAAAARHPALSARTADVRALPFDDDEFDAIFSNSTLDHFDSTEEIVSALSECGRVLRPGGQLIVTLDNPWNPIVALSKSLPRARVNRVWPQMRAASSIGLRPYRVGVTLSIKGLRDALENLGLEVRETGAIVHAPRLLAVVAGEVLGRRTGDATHRRFLGALMRCEALASSPARFVTGHFVGARAIKPPSG